MDADDRDTETYVEDVFCREPFGNDLAASSLLVFGCRA
jgi:hypothetical protein